MIVQCDKCATKFRISKDKVTARGVKVRCSRCAHIFVVRSGGRASGLPKSGGRGRGGPQRGSVRPPEPETRRIDPSSMASLLQGSASRSAATATSTQAAVALGFTGRTPPPSLSGEFEAVTAQVDLKPRSSDLRSRDLPTPDLPASAKANWHPGHALSDVLTADVSGPPAAGPGVSDELADRLDTELIPPEGLSSEGIEIAAPRNTLTPSGGLEAFPPPALGALMPAVGRSGDIPGLLPPGSIADDPFDNLDVFDAEPELPADGAYASFEPVLDDLSERAFEPDPRPSSLDPHPPSGALARIALEGPAAGAGPRFNHVEPTAVAPAYQEQKEASADLSASESRGLWPSALGAIVGLLVVLFGFPEVARPLLTPLAPEPVLAVLGYLDDVQDNAVRGVRALGTHAGPYETGAGRTLLVVAGRAKNETDRPIEELSAVVRIFVEDKVIAREEVPVGVTLRPRALNRIVSPRELDVAWAVAGTEAAPGPLRQGSERPFMAVFYEPKPVDGRRRVEVEFVRGGAPN